jgi:hypothetical protein
MGGGASSPFAASSLVGDLDSLSLSLDVGALPEAILSDSLDDVVLPGHGCHLLHGGVQKGGQPSAV